MYVYKYKIYAEYKAKHQNINRGNFNFLETLYFKNCLHYTYITFATGKSICVSYFLWRNKRPRITNTNGRRKKGTCS